MNTRKPVVVMPPVWALSFNEGHWCELSEVCALVPEIYIDGNLTFTPTPEQLVSKFAALIRPNGPGLKQVPGRERPKLFRYSEDGTSLRDTMVPVAANAAPPHVSFELCIGAPYPESLFVPAGWSMDTLLAVRSGAVSASDRDGMIYGYPARGSSSDHVRELRKPGDPPSSYRW